MNKISNLILILSILFCLVSELKAQLSLSNRSFEGLPADATMPAGWYSESEGTTPDILPGFWGVYTEPSDGDTYLGLITRENGSFESIGQRLPSKLKKGKCYRFFIDLAYSDNYSGYNKPLYLRIWASQRKGKRDHLIYKSIQIDHLDWKTYEILFEPNDDYQYIIFEAFISEQAIQYKGNILIDNMSFITICNRA